MGIGPGMVLRVSFVRLTRAIRDDTLTMNGVSKFTPKRVNSDSILAPCYGVVPKSMLWSGPYTPWNLESRIRGRRNKRTISRIWKTGWQPFFLRRIYNWHFLLDRMRNQLTWTLVNIFVIRQPPSPSWPILGHGLIRSVKQEGCGLHTSNWPISFR
jgi:hypothetical protein